MESLDTASVAINIDSRVVAYRVRYEELTATVVFVDIAHVAGIDDVGVSAGEHYCCRRSVDIGGGAALGGHLICALVF